MKIVRQLGLAFGCLLLWVPAGKAIETNWQAKIDPQVLQTAGSEGAEFLVVLSEQADLGAAAGLKTKEEKGTYVFRQLAEAANRTQPLVLEVLIKRGLPHRAFWIANMIWTRGDLDAVVALSQRPDVARISANPPVRVPQPPTSTPTPTKVTWNLSLIHAPEVWALGYTGQGVIIGGQDTGYQWDHPALINQYRGWNGTQADHNYNWHDAIHALDRHNTTNNPCGYNLLAPCADESHGTHTMGIMVGDDGADNQIGVAPGSRWIGCRNMEQGWGTPASYTECFQWFVAPTDLNGQNPNPLKAPDVINNSWGCPPEEGCGDPLILQTVVQNVRAAGIVVVFGAGNAGPKCGTVQDPAAIYEECFSVGATDSTDHIANFSSRGPVTVDGSNRMKPNVAGPGVSISSSVPGGNYARMSGTSMASPHVAGVLALVLSAHPELRGNVAGLERLLEHTAVPLTNADVCGGVASTVVPNNTFGWGRVDAFAALGLGDADSDGIPDWWMIAHFDHAAGRADDNSRAQDDPDGDSASNAHEYLAGTDPLDAASFFHIASITTGPASVSLAFQSSISRLYSLFSQTNLTQDGWLPVEGQVDVLGTGGPLSLTRTNLPSSATEFYRISVRMAPSANRSGPGRPAE
jgi:serine protease AprX